MWVGVPMNAANPGEPQVAEPYYLPALAGPFLPVWRIALPRCESVYRRGIQFPDNRAHETHGAEVVVDVDDAVVAVNVAGGRAEDDTRDAGAGELKAFRVGAAGFPDGELM